MIRLIDLLATQKRLLQQQREIQRLQREVAALKARNESMRDGMRRCLSCDYRIETKRRQDAAAEHPQAPPGANEHK